MTDSATAVPDTANVPVARDLVQPLTGQQVTPEDSVSSHCPIDNDSTKKVSPSGDLSNHTAADSPEATQAGKSAAADVKGGKILPALKKPLQGPRGGIHWGAGQSSKPLHCLAPVVCIWRLCLSPSSTSSMTDSLAFLLLDPMQTSWHGR